VLENRVPRRIFGPKRDEVAGGWRNLHTEEFNNLQLSRSERQTKQRHPVFDARTICFLSRLSGHYNIIFL
jgi:hypothetical protein